MCHDVVMAVWSALGADTCLRAASFVSNNNLRSQSKEQQRSPLHPQLRCFQQSRRSDILLRAGALRFHSFVLWASQTCAQFGENLADLQRPAATSAGSGKTNELSTSFLRG